MKKKITALSLSVGLLAFGAGGAMAKTDAAKSKKVGVQAARQVSAANELAAVLPKSDALALFNTRRMFELAPELLAENPKFFSRYNEMLDKIQTSIGIDLRQFETLAFGATYVKNAQGKFDLRPTLAARGNISAGAMVAAARVAANGKYQEQKVNGKTVYVFRMEEIMRDIAEKRAKNASATGTISDADRAKIENGLKLLRNSNLQELAVIALDANTLVLGDLNQVKTTVDGTKTPNVNNNLLVMMNERPNAIFRFAGNVPKGTATVLGLENDEIGKTIGVLKQVRGWLDSANGSSQIFIGGNTAQREQAESLEDVLTMLKMLGGNILRGKTGDKNQSLKTLLDNLKISRNETEVQLSLSAPTADIAKIISKF